MERHDDLVQGLTAIHWALEAGAYELARDSARVTLEQAQAMLAELVECEAVAPGELRRDYRP